VGTQLPSPKKEAEPPPTPKFSTHFYCGCISMPLGMEVGFSPGDFVLDGDRTPSPQRGGVPSIFGPCLLWPNGCMDQHATWYRGRPWPTRRCIRCRPSFPSPKGVQPPIFGLCLLWPNGWMDQDAQATLC